MSGAATTAGGAPTAASGATNPWLIAMVVSLATFMEVLDTTIDNVALRYISGGLAFSGDDSFCLVTTFVL